MMNNDSEYDTISAAIGELRSDSRRHSEFSNSILLELRRLTERMEFVSQLGTELREYRKTLHDRFDRINEIAAQTTLQIDKIEDRLSVLENEKLIALERRVATIETTWKTQLKLIAIIGSVILTVGGWFVGTYGQSILKVLFSSTS